MIHLYCRVSSSKQIEGLSLTIQGDAGLVEKIAERFETTVNSQVYIDEGVSAYSGKNARQGDLKAFLDDIDTGHVKVGDILVCRALDRITRLGLSDAFNVYNKIITAGVLIYTTMDDRLYKKDDQQSHLFATFALSTANEESAKKSYLTNKYASFRIKQFLEGKKSEDGYAFDIGVGRHPFWITLQEKVVKPNAKIGVARGMVGMALKKKAGIELCREYAAANGVKLSYSAVAKLFHSKALYGVLEVALAGKKYELENYYPSICSKSEFELIQRQKATYTTRKATKNQSLLSGLRRLFCPNGYSLIAIKTKGTLVYKCGTVGCSCGTYMPQYSLNRLVLSAIQEPFFQPSNLIDVKEKQLKDKICIRDEKQAKFSRLQTIVADNPDSFDETMIKKLSTMKREIEVLENAIASLELDLIQEKEAIGAPLDDIEAAVEQYYFRARAITKLSRSENSADMNEARERIQQIVKRIDFIRPDTVRVQPLLGAPKWFYFPKHSDPRRRSWVALTIISESNEDMCPYTYTTEESIRSGKFGYFAENCPPRLLELASPVPVNGRRRFIEKVRGLGATIWKRKTMIENGFTAGEWQQYKDIDLSDEGFFMWDIEYRNANYKTVRSVVVAVEDMFDGEIQELIGRENRLKKCFPRPLVKH